MSDGREAGCSRAYSSVVGLNLLGVLPLPSFGATPGAPRRRGALGALLLGLVFGAALGPCTFAFMAPLLGIALHAGSSDAAFGVLLVALFGIGHAGAIAFAGASLQSVQRWLGFRAGARAIESCAPEPAWPCSVAARTSSTPRCDAWNGRHLGGERRRLEHMTSPALEHEERDVPRPERPVRAAVGLGLALAAWGTLYWTVQPLSELVTFRLLRLAPESHLGRSVAFFVYEVPKVLLLLVVVVFGVGIVRSFFTPERTRAILAGKRESVGNVLASALGVVTPFCSCSAVPLFIGFVEVGIPLGVTLSFLVAAPMVNEVALVLLLGLFGWRWRPSTSPPASGSRSSSGFVLGRLGSSGGWSPGCTSRCSPAPPGTRSSGWGSRGGSRRGRRPCARSSGRCGPTSSSGLRSERESTATCRTACSQGSWASPRGGRCRPRSSIGVPMYSNAAGIVPVVQALLGKGAALGTVFAFMMSVIALSLPGDGDPAEGAPPARSSPRSWAWSRRGILAVGWLFNAVL